MDRVVFCEGADDARALRGLLRTAFQLLPAPQSARFQRPTVVSFRVGAEGRVDIVPAGSKEQALTLAVSEALGRSSPGACSLIGVSFDPDGDTISDSEAWIGEALSGQGAHTSPYEWECGSRRLIALPWSISTPIFDSLTDAMNLERVAVYAASQTAPEFAPIVESWLNQLAALAGDNRTRHWKEAALLWHAATWPKIPEASFFDKVFEQDSAMATVAARALAGEPWWSGLQKLVTP